MASLASSLAKASMGADRYVVGPCRSSTSSSSSSSSSSSCSSGSSSPCSSTSSSSSGITTEEEEDKNSSSSSSWNSSDSSSLTDISTAKKRKKKDNKEVNKTRKKKKTSSSIKKMKNLKNLKRESNKKKEKNKSKSMAVVVVDRKKKKKKKKKHIKSTAHEENGDDVSSMLLLGAELLKEVEEAAAAASSATLAVVSVNPMEESRSSSTNHRPLLLPIGHYVTQTGADSRSHLLEQVMSSVPAAQWQAILPPVLKEMNSTELKQLCLQQLQLLTDSAILNIINGEGDQGATGSTGKGILSSSEMAITTTGEKEKLKKKKSKKSIKSKKKSKKTKKSERLLSVKEEKAIDDVAAAEESSGKTLMELLELEMRARAIKALLKKEEEGIEDDEWSDHVVVPSATLPVENDAIQRPMKAATVTESGVGHKYHRPNSPTIHSTLIQRTESNSDESNRRGRRPSSDAVRHRHYRHHHHHRQDRSRSPILTRREVDLSVVKTEPEPTSSSSTNLNKSSTPSRSPLLIEATDDSTTIQVGRINSEESKRIDDEDKSGDDRRTTQVVVEEEEVEYEEEGIQEVDIELGSGSDDDDAHSSCR